MLEVEINWWWLLPPALSGLWLAGWSTWNHGTPARFVPGRSLRWLYRLMGITLLYTGSFLAYYRSPITEHMLGEGRPLYTFFLVLFMLFGFGVVYLSRSFMSIERIRRKYQRDVDMSSTYINRDTTSEVSPRERVLGKEQR